MALTDMRVLEAQPYYNDERARVVFKFGNMLMDTATLCHVRVRVENRRGQVADGWGAMFLSHMWAFRTPAIQPPHKDAVMRRLVEALCQRITENHDYAHPIDHFRTLEFELPAINARIGREMNLPEEMPYLGVLVCAAPLDAALHDAFGIVNNISTYDGYGPDFMSDLSTYLGPTFKGRYVSDFVKPTFAPLVPIFHTVGGLDILRAVDVTERVDGYPHSLEQWIKRDGVYCFKVKLNGRDTDWDLQRLIEVYRIARETHPNPQQTLYLSADTNEQSQHPDYMVDLLHRLRETAPDVYDALLLVEQPTERDLTAHRFDMRELAALKPTIIDESLTSLADLELALELGWSGVALKACKCQSIELLIAAWADVHGIDITVQDLTCPGIALLQSVGLTARLNSMMNAVEANARQYYPETSRLEMAVHGDIMLVRDGVVHTKSLRGPGLGYQREKIGRTIFG